MARKWKALIIVVCVACTLGAVGTMAWHLWPEPPPPTAEDVCNTVMELDPAKLSEEDLDKWIDTLASTVERLPPHEVSRLIEEGMRNPQMQERIASLKPEQMKKLSALIPSQQKVRIMAEGIKQLVEGLDAMHPYLRKKTLQGMHAMRTRRRKGKHRRMTKERFAEWHIATTPRQRAKMVRYFRKMRVFLEEAGIRDD